ncbi:MAG: HAD-IA family hydrolase [Rubrivivax sp.]
MPAPRAFDLVLFDLDGTLVDTAAEITDAVNAALREVGLAAVDAGFVTRRIGHGGAALLRGALAARGGAPAGTPEHTRQLAALLTTFEQVSAARCGVRSRPYPEAARTLDALRAAGVSLALVTNKEQRATHCLLRAHALSERFDRVVCGDTFVTRKPDPAGVLDCLRQFGVEPARALFIGDSAIDAETARAAGIAVWLLPHGYNGGRPVEQAAPDRVLPDLAAVRAALLPLAA